jgi:tetratricopeptide (TPR) repeat protein
MFEQSATEKLLADTRTLVEQGRYAEAIESYQTAMARSEHVDERLFAFAINGLGIVYMNEGKPQPALDCFIRAYNILCKRKEWRTDGAVVCDSIGVIYNNLGDYSKALEYEFRSLKIFNQLSEFTHAAEAFNIACSYLLRGLRQSVRP